MPLLARTRTRLATLMASLALLAACGTATPASPVAAPTAGPLTTLRTGYIPNVVFAPLFVGIERGYFTQEGIKIELTPIASGNDAVVQLGAGNFDVAMGGANAGLFNAAQRGVKFAIVAPLHTEVPPDTSPLIISAKATGITSIADLKGKKVAVNAKGTALEYWLSQALAKGGLKMTDVQMVTMPFADMPAALESGSLDAAVATEPAAIVAKTRGVGKVLSDDFINGFTATYVYMGEPLLAKPDTAKAFLRAYLRACRDLSGGITPEIGAVVEKYTKVPAALLTKTNAAHYDPNGKVTPENIAALQDFFMQRGYLQYTAPLDVKTFINTTLAAEAAASLK